MFKCSFCVYDPNPNGNGQAEFVINGYSVCGYHGEDAAEDGNFDAADFGDRIGGDS